MSNDNSLDKLKDKYLIGDDHIVPDALAEMMVTEYDPDDKHNQEVTLFENLELLYKSHEVLRERNEKALKYLKQCKEYINSRRRKYNREDNDMSMAVFMMIEDLEQQ